MPHHTSSDEEDVGYYSRSTNNSTSNNWSPNNSSTSTRASSTTGSAPRTSLTRQQSKRKKKKAASVAAAAQQEITRQLASLQLPHMPPPPLPTAGGASGASESHDNPPMLRILVVADIDLASASALAESALAGGDDDEKNPLHRVDLCIACGPFCREEDLRGYYQGRQRRRHMARYNYGNSSNGANNSHSHSAAPFLSKRGGGGGNAAMMMPLPPMPYHPQQHAHQNNSQQHQQNQYPYKRTREETAALEGLMTAALSQLESIVCRVVFVPGRTDPITTVTSSCNDFAYTKERRLTPNSRNIHQHWMPLSPGLGCAGLLYLDWQRLQQQPPPLEDDHDDDDDDHEDDSESSSIVPEDSSFSYGGEDNLNSPSTSGGVGGGGVPPRANSLSRAVDAERAKQYGTEFCSHLERLVQGAPPTSAVSETPPQHAQITGLLKTTLFQSILVTHFHHLEKDEVSEVPSMHHSARGGDDGDQIIQEREGELLEQEEEEDDEEECFDPPWPTEHESFCALPLVQEHVLLEIAAGRNSTGSPVKPMEVPKGKMRVVLPGSLRERGEYCLVDVAFMKGQHKTDDYRWRVRRTRFQTISDFV